ncbi:hypothetical protein [Streptomyces sp. 769]|uniref:hypothetical protein n=1 Tax=Streptomyces sp. 769 TaxID=1262452 RepID=UPI00057CA4D6|nr:hypothetical protein [Streptomyces sp. 769]AJC52865.1 hypothetical protein GZL_00259 [Streptomyces sp. 769]
MSINNLGEFAHTWEAIREDYDTLSNDEYDQSVLDCAARLAADPAGQTAYAWTLGLVLMAPYLGYAIDDTGKPEAVAVLHAADSALHHHPCAHDTPALDLAVATSQDRPECLLAVHAVAAYAASDMCEAPSVLKELINALEKTLPHYADATCGHTQHTEPPRWAPDLAELGIQLSSPGGRARYERTRRQDEDPPLENLLCPVTLARIAQDSLKSLRSRHSQLIADPDAEDAAGATAA